MWGDPHFQSLDGKVFTFNGIGEYTMMAMDDNSFVLQGRTAQAKRQDGSPAPGSALVAVAAQEQGSEKVHIGMNSAGNGLELIIDGIDQTDKLFSPELTKTFGRMEVFNNQTREIKVTFASGTQ